LPRIEGFGDVVVGAHLEADDSIDDGAGRGQHDDRDLRVALAQVPGEAQAVFAGHVDVDEREVDRLCAGERPRRCGTLGTDRSVAVGDEVLLEHRAYFRLVIDYQDCGFRTHGYGALRISP